MKKERVRRSTVLGHARRDAPQKDGAEMQVRGPGVAGGLLDENFSGL